MVLSAWAAGVFSFMVLMPVEIVEYEDDIKSINPSTYFKYLNSNVGFMFTFVFICKISGLNKLLNLGIVCKIVSYIALN